MIEEDKTKRRGKGVVVVLVVALAALGLFKWLTVATPISKKDAIQLFERANRAAGPHEIAEELEAEPGSDRHRRTAGEADTRRRQPEGREEGPQSTTAPTDPALVTEPVVPNEGVYTYETEGGEKISGAEFRRFPKTTYRGVVHTGSRSWTEHHTFIKQRQTWASFTSEGAALLANWTRQYVAFGGDRGSVPIDKRIDFSPPLRLLWLPWKPERTWKGSFKDAGGQNVYGSYTITTRLHDHIDVGGESVEVWMEEVIITIHGEYEGSTTVKRWTSPAHGVAVREESVADVRQGPLRYTADWSLQLSGLRPSR